MDLYLLDYLSANRQSKVHRISALPKIIITMLLICLLLFLKDIKALLVIYIFLNIITFFADLPWNKIFALSFYPILFMLLFAFAIPAIGLAGFVVILLRTISISMTMVILFATTPYPCVFGYLGKILPSFLTTILFLTYKSIFIILSIFKEVKIGFYLKGGVGYKHPIRLLKNISRILGYLVIRAMDESQIMYEMMKVRGFKNRINHMGIH